MTHSFPCFLDTQKAPRILCVGDLMLDRFVYGSVERISPEAPIPVIRIDHEHVMVGGCGNVVRNVADLDSSVDVIGVIGKDVCGQEFTTHLNSLPKTKAHMIVDETRPTTLKVRYVAGSQQMLRADHETSRPLSAEIEGKIIEEIKASLPSCDIVILSDYAKGVLTPTTLAQTIKIAKQAGKPVLIDPKGRDFSRYAGATLVTPNRKELAEVIGYAIDSAATAEKAARALIAAHDFQGMLVKLGSDGVCLVMKGQDAKHFQATAREVFDVSGAGDTVVATLAVAMGCGETIENAALLANAGGAVVVGKIGTATVTRAEIAREVRSTQMNRIDDKILSIDEALAFAEAARAKGQKIGFTNGCFDLIHPGHISSIRQARKVCDKLIVGLNSDESIRRLKGPQRPVQDEMSRATVIAALMDVDAVVLFEGDTPTDLINTLRPDFLIKGKDYTVDQVVGHEEVARWGGKVVLTDILDGQSTSSIIQRSRT